MIGDPNSNYPPGVTGYDIDNHAPKYDGDPEDATCDEYEYEQWAEWVGQWFGGEELAEFYNDGYTPREVNKLAAAQERRLESMADRRQLEMDGGKE